MEQDRRQAPRARVHFYFNKYIDGVPYACEALEVSKTGMLIRRILEPDAARAIYGLELAPDAEVGENERLWLCARSIWSEGPFEAVSFVAQSHVDDEKLGRLIERAALAA